VLNFPLPHCQFTLHNTNCTCIRLVYRTVRTQTDLLYCRTALFWAVTQRLVVIPYRRFGTTYQFQICIMYYIQSVHNNILLYNTLYKFVNTQRVGLCQKLSVPSSRVKIGPIGCPETSVRILPLLAEQQPRRAQFSSSHFAAEAARSDRYTSRSPRDIITQCRPAGQPASTAAYCFSRTANRYSRFRL